VQALIDRRFYRRKYDAARALAEFTTGARDETDLEQLTARLRRVMERTVQPAHISLWLKARREERRYGELPALKLTPREARRSRRPIAVYASPSFREPLTSTGPTPATDHEWEMHSHRSSVDRSQR
jgi:hypothetical protein